MKHGAQGALRMEQGTVIRLTTAQGSFEGVLDDTAIAKAIVKALPMKAQVNRWGEEIYFDVPVKLANTAPTRAVKVGDIAYWPEGPCLCIFFGKTPASKEDEPRPASEVTVLGHTRAPLEQLRAITEGTTIAIQHALRPGLRPRSGQW